MLPLQDELIQVSQALKATGIQYVFVGGAIAPMLITDPAASYIRPTDDVDVVVQIVSRGSYYRLEKELQSQGFRHDINGPVCRWEFGSCIVDIMPMEGGVLGFSNQWYPEALRSAITYPITDTETIPVCTAPIFIATKIEAFKQRGDEDYYASHDLEDIISVIDGRPELAEEIRGTADSVRLFLSETFGMWLNTPDFTHALPGHLPYASMSNERAEIIKQRIHQMSVM